MPQTLPKPSAPPDRVQAVLRRYWGFDTLRPLQAEAIAAGLDRRDSLVVMPTGGGKSLCYQVPAVVADRVDVVVSPLIALMKDQVDGLRAAGYPAVALHSGLTPRERREADEGLRNGAFRLVFVAPEKMLTAGFLTLAKRMNVSAFAIDEAHCISQWGHDFRPEYRQLATLGEHFPQASMHAYTATATKRVRQDIVEQLGLRNPLVLVGTFDRPNLIYRILPQVDVYSQTVETLRRHANEAAIVYCLSRRDTETMAAVLKEEGFRAAHYHAGMEAPERRRTQEAFAREELDVIAATVAFGMGIDRSNVRCVIHATMPKTVEHYQQETGRAGRDGLEAECVLLYSGGDFMRWKGLISRSAQEAEDPEAVVEAQTALLEHMRKMCSGQVCRHKALSEYFGQHYERPNCGACDVCLNEVEGVEDGTVTAQKILSCVARTEQRFGVGHVADVLLGANTKMIRQCGHDKLSTWGLLKGTSKKEVVSMIYQLVDQDVLQRTEGEMPVLKLNSESVRVMRGQTTVRFQRARKDLAAHTAAEEAALEQVDAGLMEALRGFRRQLAEERRLPPFVIFDDNVLRGLALVRPTSDDMLRRVKGIGDTKRADFGKPLLAAIAAYCSAQGLETNQARAGGGPGVRPPKMSKPNPLKDKAMRMFAQGRSVADVVAAIGRAPTTVAGYLAEHVMLNKPASIEAWVDVKTYQRVAEAAQTAEDGRLTPIFEKLGGAIPYEQIRLVLAHMRVRGQGTVRKAMKD